MNGHGFGTFMLGLTAGGMTLEDVFLQLKAAKHVSEAVETLTDAMGM